MKRVRLPLDHLAELWPNNTKGARVGALLHPASVSASLRHTSQILEELSAQTQSRPGEVPPSHSRDGCAPNRLNAALAHGSRSGRFSDVTDLLVRPYDLPEPEVPRREFGFYRGLLKR
jgi:hypothetical protein